MFFFNLSKGCLRLLQQNEHLSYEVEMARDLVISSRQMKGMWRKPVKEFFCNGLKTMASVTKQK